MRRAVALLALVTLAACGTEPTSDTVPSTAPGTTSSPNTSVSYSTRLVGSIESPVDLVERSADDAWYYVVSQAGTVEKWSRDGAQRDTVLDVSAATSVGGERGLLGLAFRRVADQWQAFLNRTNRDGDTEVTVLPVRDDGTFQSSTDVGRLVIRIAQPYSNHNGGALAIGPDNMLFIGMGDGGSANDPKRYSLDRTSLLGKILRIDPKPDGGYDIPEGNPYADSPRPEIWSVGVRNPWRISFDVHGTLWVADVGQNEWEEVTALPSSDGYPGGRGANLGWSAYEGTQRFNTDQTAADHVAPVHVYDHDDGRCSISGAAVGNNTSAPGRAGWFFYGDYCNGEVRAILTDGSSTVASEPVVAEMGNITAVRSTADRLYVLTADGKVRELVVTRG